MLSKVFGSEREKELIEFGQEISNIDSDFIIVAARKAFRLYDLLTKTGHCNLARPIYSQRVLEQKLDWIAGSTVTIVDDTLILGSTLHEMKSRLEKAGAKVQVIVFCTNKKWYLKDFVVPDNNALPLDDQDVVKFCEQQVTAFSEYGIPYIVDFPISTKYKLNYQNLESNDFWNSYSLTMDSEHRNGLIKSTLLPNKKTYGVLEKLLGKYIWRTLDIVKVRIFGKENNDGTSEQFAVPIVTFKNMSTDVLNTIFNETIKSYFPKNSYNKFISRLNTSKSKLRLIQYIYSMLLGNIFSQTYLERHRMLFQESETQRLFGSWFIEEMKHLHTNAKKIFNRKVLPERYVRGKENVSGAELPKRIVKLLDETIEQQNIEQPDLFTVFSDLFVMFFRKIEIPSRIEANSIGAERYLQSENRDRLKFGIPWNYLARKIAEANNMKPTRDVFNRMSLILDFWNDLGVCVPTTVEYDDVIYRSYRHGELGAYGEREQIMQSIMLKKFANFRGTNSISELVLLKISALFFRQAIEDKSIRVIQGADEKNNDCIRIGYYLHGVVPFVPSSEKGNNGHGAYFPEKDSVWIQNRLESQGVVKRIKNDNKYKKSTFEIQTDDTSEQLDLVIDDRCYAESIGGYLGNCLRENIIQQDELIALATCPDTVSTLAALNTESQLIYDFLSRISGIIKSIENSNKGVMLNHLKGLQAGKFKSIHAEVFKKYNWWSNDVPQAAKNKIIEGLLKMERYKTPREELAISKLFSYVYSMKMNKDNASYIIKIGECISDITNGFILIYRAYFLLINKLYETEVAKKNENLNILGNSLSGTISNLKNLNMEDEATPFILLQKSIEKHLDYCANEKTLLLKYEQWIEPLSNDFEYHYEVLKKSTDERAEIIDKYYLDNRAKQRVMNFVWFDVIDSKIFKSKKPSMYERFLSEVDGKIEELNNKGHGILFVKSLEQGTTNDERMIAIARKVMDVPRINNQSTLINPEQTAITLLKSIYRIGMKYSIKLRMTLLDNNVFVDKDIYLNDNGGTRGFEGMASLKSILNWVVNHQKSNFPDTTFVAVDAKTIWRKNTNSIKEGLKVEHFNQVKESFMLNGDEFSVSFITFN